MHAIAALCEVVLQPRRAEAPPHKRHHRSIAHNPSDELFEEIGKENVARLGWDALKRARNDASVCKAVLIPVFACSVEEAVTAVLSVSTRGQ